MEAIAVLGCHYGSTSVLLKRFGTACGPSPSAWNLDRFLSPFRPTNGSAAGVVGHRFGDV